MTKQLPSFFFFFSPSSTETMERTEFSEAENFEPPKKKKNKDKDNKNQRRFSDEQIKLLETMFESETRLEPKKKVQLARELGLQPRQVAIWFQNRRARWKSKQIEQDFRALRAEYDSLVSKFETLKEEKQSLVLQLQKLGDLVRNTHGENCKDGGSSSKTGNPKSEIAKPSLQEGFSEERGGVFAQLSDSTANNDGEDLRQQGHEEDELVVVNTSQEVGDASIVSLESWYRHDHQGSVFDQPRGCSQWLNFWS